MIELGCAQFVDHLLVGLRDGQLGEVGLVGPLHRHVHELLDPGRRGQLDERVVAPIVDVVEGEAVAALTGDPDRRIHDVDPVHQTVECPGFGEFADEHVVDVVRSDAGRSERSRAGQPFFASGQRPHPVSPLLEGLDGELADVARRTCDEHPSGIVHRHGRRT